MLLLSGQSQAKSDVIPGVYMRYEYTDNLFLSPDDEHDEQIAAYGPMLKIVHAGTLLQLDLDYTYERYSYRNDPELDTLDEKHFGNMVGMLFPGRDFNVELQADAKLESLDRRRADVTTIPTINTVNRYHGQGRPVYKFRLGRRHLAELAYVYEIVEYDNEAADETESHKYELALENKQSEQLKLRLAGFFEQFEASRNADYDHAQATLGVEWRSARVLELSLAGGMSWFEFDDGTDFESGVADGEVRIAVGKRHAVDFEYADAVEHDITAGQYETRRAAGSISRNSRFGWQIGYVYRDDHFVEVDRDDLYRGVLVTLSYQLTRKLEMVVAGESWKLEFEPLAERVDRDSLSAAVEYLPRDLIRLGCRYEYRNNDSSIDNNDYVENRVYCEAGLSFALVRR